MEEATSWTSKRILLWLSLYQQTATLRKFNVIDDFYVFYRIMKNIELYRTIESLVKFRHQNSNPTHKSFAHDYCKRQIQKKKLIPFNPKSKMNQIMKNFHQLDTYVNVEQLFDYINLLITEKKKEEGEKSMGSLRWKNSNNFIPYENRTIEKVR